MHSGGLNGPKSCRVCGFSSPDKATFFKHLTESQHGASPRFKCSDCSECFWDNRLLMEHRASKNHWTNAPSNAPKSAASVCSQCQRQFDSNADLKAHLKAENHYSKPRNINQPTPQAANDLEVPMATQVLATPLAQEEKQYKKHPRTTQAIKNKRPSSAPVVNKGNVVSIESAGTHSNHKKLSFVQANDSIVQVFTKLGLKNAEALAAETIAALGAGNALELREVFAAQPSDCNAQLREVLSQHPYFQPKGSSATGSTQALNTWPSDARGARITRQREANLPIFASREVFLERLRSERVLIVTAATGSGKTTQLPQYATDDPAFSSGRIVCTQPRALAAISIARRIGDEYDGPGVSSNNVGYTVGGGKAKLGDRIQLMTDAALVKLAQKEATLKSISVLIIDEAHERSLNTDLVLAIAKLVLAKRQNDFYVVVASATIDERPFLRFFFGDAQYIGREALKVPGKVFPISIEEQPIEYKKNRDYLPMLIKIVFQTLRDHPYGHCLVFLPGQNEIDQAIKLFERDRDTATWVTKALYGGLPHDKQAEVLAFNNDGGRLRMICFCTNVAETSLTVQGIGLVVDSGIAKEARYDVKRRMTVLEEVLISKSSADQRKGRSGRTGPGHCVRLFSYDALPRDQIQPEILRASLDLVVLQLLTLGYDPRTFPFMDRPADEDLDNAFQLMQSFDCLDERLRVTTFGHLLNVLPFDPRMSKFVVDCFALSQHAQPALKLAAEIAGILTAPGSLFFMGGGKGADTAASKAETKANIARRAAVHSSDLLFLLQVYQNWQRAGMDIDVATSTCAVCKKIVQRKGKVDSHCRPCRSAYTQEWSLNNKILSGIGRTVDGVVQTILDSKHFEKIAVRTNVDVDMAEIVGQALIGSFKEQLCQVIIPHNPSEGVFLCALKQRAVIQNTSAIAQKMGDKAQGQAKLYVAYEITKLPNGMFIADRLHPVSSLPPGMTVMEIELSYERKPLHISFMHDLKKWFLANYAEHEMMAGVAFEYGDRDLAVRVYCPAPWKPMVYSLCASVVDARIQHMLAYELTRCIGNGTALVTVRGGLVTESLESVGLACRIRVDQHLPENVQDDATFREWVVKTFKARVMNADAKKEIKWTKFFHADRNNGIVVFTNQDVATRAVRALAAFMSHDTQAKGLFTNLDENWGRAVLFSLQTNSPITKDELETQFGVQDILTVKNLTSTVTKLRINDLPMSTTKADLRQIVKVVRSINLVAHQGQSQTAYLEFDSAQEKDDAEAKLQQSLVMTTPYIKAYTNQSGNHKTKNVLPSFFQADGKATISRVSVVFTSSSAADAFVRKVGTGELPPAISKVQGQAIAFVDKWYCFDGVALVAAIENRFGVKGAVSTQKSGAKQKIEFTGASPVACGQAAQALAQSTAPSKVVFNDMAQQFLFTELHESGDLRRWAEELHLHAELKSPGPMGRRWRFLMVHGEPVRQGELMRRIGDAYDAFQHRFLQLPLGASVRLFLKGKVGDQALNNLKTEFQKDCHIETVKQTQCIQLYIRQGVDSTKAENMLQQATVTIHHVVNEFGSSVPAFSACVYCRSPTQKPQTLSICGHHACQGCLESALQDDTASDQLPLRCPSCDTILTVHDIPKNISIDATLAQSAQRYFQVNKPSRLGMCPQAECCSFIALPTDNPCDTYVKCTSCLVDLCVACGVVNAELHRGITCTAYAEKMRLVSHFDLEALFEGASKFVTDNWTPTTGCPVTIERNPNLQQGCLSLQRYLKGVRAMGQNGLEALKTSTMFVWHGTTEVAIAPICANGFDPKRRAGQVHGPGEYFGVNADVSLGYTRGVKRLIAAQVIRLGAHFKEVTGFCYVINNPQDWGLCYNLPVAVATYDATLPPVQFVSSPQSCRPVEVLVDELFQSGSSAASAKPIRGGVDATVREGATWQPPFRWQWLDDVGKFQTYSDSISTLLETAFAQSAQFRSTPYLTPHIVRYLDDRPQQYVINFEQMTQSNQATGFTRRIQRIKDDPDNKKYATALWQYASNDNVWQNVEEVAQVEIEKAFRAYVDFDGPPKRRVHVLRQTYEVNFVGGTQTNADSGTERRIRRVDATSLVATTETLKLILCRTSSVLGLVQSAPGIQIALEARLERASGVVGRISQSKKNVELSVDVTNPLHVLVTMVLHTKLARSMVAVLFGTLKTNIYDKCGDVFKVVNATGRHCQRILASNPRLAQLTYKQPPTKWQSRDDILLQIVHFTLWQQGTLDCYVYGGFVRDWVIRGESANDVDISVPSASAAQQLHRMLVDHVCRHTKLRAAASLEAKGSAMCLKLMDPLGALKTIEIDLVDRSRLKTVSPGVDCDAGNICLRGEGVVDKRYKEAGGEALPLAKCVRHCEKAQFVFFYDLTDPVSSGMAKQRLEKYLKRQWTCLTPLPESIVQSLPQTVRQYVKPKAKYTTRGGSEVAG
ncbi:Aste57867_23618 [Aphanomyces stellatus]|uniref:Aste57867_23618 protein n=1 Tax=Aphanomyces stellatus TaxID=120398 RepID=A0A485LNA2_9STRA|nr:hypothetical protein As57867_023546 [Aphanomyces stellatus]VFU00263.1 Aste57867_23618 [Aphanomyces stellatus]